MKPLTGQQIFFYVNHPIKWVRIAGIVVAVDEFEGRRVYTIDDSSGLTIECVANVPIPPKPGQKRKDDPMSDKEKEKEHPLPVVDGDIDVGHVIDIKGSVKTFRHSKQILADKISHLRSTDQEVQFWEKVMKLRKEVLSQPWVLTTRELRRCRKEAEVNDKPRQAGVEKRTGLDRRTRLKKEERHPPSRPGTCIVASNPVTHITPHAAERGPSGRERDLYQGKESEYRHHRVVAIARAEKYVPPLPKPSRKKETGLERKTKKPGIAVPVSGNYDALGL